MAQIVNCNDCRFAEDIKNIKKILQGNGDPNSGVCVRLALLTQSVETLIIKIDDMTEAIERKEIANKSNNTKIKVALISSISGIIIATITCLWGLL